MYDELVGAIINIGEESTNVSIFNRGIQIKNSLIPMGSKNVDKDITYIFKSKLSDSRKIKEEFSVSLSDMADSEETWVYEISKGDAKEVNQLGVSKVVEARVKEILNLSKKEIKNLTNREIRYIIITGGLTELSLFSRIVEEEFGFVAKVNNMTTLGVRHNSFSSCFGIIKYFDDKLTLRGKTYKMFSSDDIDTILSIDSNISNENMISKVFGHFFER